MSVLVFSSHNLALQATRKAPLCERDYGANIGRLIRNQIFVVCAMTEHNIRRTVEITPAATATVSKASSREPPTTMAAKVDGLSIVPFSYHSNRHYCFRASDPEI